MNRMTAIRAMLHKYNELHGKAHQLNHDLAWGVKDLAEMAATVDKAREVCGKRYADAVEAAVINYQGAVFVNGKFCGYIA